MTQLEISLEWRCQLRAGRLHCHYCPATATTWDHIVPLSKGGADAERNIVPACAPCNEAKKSDLPTCSCDRCQRALAWWEWRIEWLSLAPRDGFLRLRRWLQTQAAT